MASEWLVAAKMGELLASDRFDKDSITEKDLSLSQAFCLLWQNQDTGDVAGRQSPNAMTDTASAAVLLDLYVLEKIDLEKEIKQWMDKKRQVIMVKVKDFDARRSGELQNDRRSACCKSHAVDAERMIGPHDLVKDAMLTGSYLDQALFSDIVKYHQRTINRPRTLVEWIIQGSYERENSATVVLDSLVQHGILTLESKLFGRRYPTVNSDPQRKLVDEIRKVVLQNQHADGFIWALLKLMYEAECCIGKKAALLSRYFSSEELPAAKEVIKTLVTVNLQDEHITDTPSAQSFELEIVG